jgi:hypothetical protein
MKILRFVLIPLVLWGCSTTRVVSPSGMAALAPAMSVERFLQASNDRDLHGMANLFGTADGPWIETGSTFGCMFKKMGDWFGMGESCRTIQDVELRMDLIAEILTHEDYTITSDSRVPGREHPTTQVNVNLRIRGRDVPNVPFYVVQTGEGRWLVEEIELNRITG